MNEPVSSERAESVAAVLLEELCLPPTEKNLGVARRIAGKVLALENGAERGFPSRAASDEAEVAWNHAALTLLGGQVREGYDIGAEMLARFEELQAELEEARAEFARGAEAMREAAAQATECGFACTAHTLDACPGYQAAGVRHRAALIRALPLPSPDGRRYRVTVREVRDCTRCHHEAEASQPGKPDEFTCQVLDCCCIHKHGRCVVAA